MNSEKKRKAVLEKIKILHPGISDQEAKEILKSLEIYCEIIINANLSQKIIVQK